ncbi:MAG: adenylyl-sulfate kinase [Planctomycetes bacterium]|jgi:adenylylsulfate kinase|nr:adenylyl-sulfate kinase [Planctomycetota bacterium]
MSPSDRNLRRHDGTVQRRDREILLGQRGGVVWFTGLSGSGKSTIARQLEAALHQDGRLVYVLDGDNLRHGLCADLGFDAAARTENIRRVSHLAALFADAGALVLTAFISPFRADRAAARAVIGTSDFVEVFVDAPLATCEARDPKGLYKKARAGQIAEFTGISSPYEAPERADLHLRNADRPLAEVVAEVQALLADRGFLRPPA